VIRSIGALRHIADEAANAVERLRDEVNALSVSCEKCGHDQARARTVEEQLAGAHEQHASDVRRLVLWAVEHGARLDSLPLRLSPEAQDAAKAAWLSGVA
jgi:hypothetical protein